MKDDRLEHWFVSLLVTLDKMDETIDPANQYLAVYMIVLGTHEYLLEVVLVEYSRVAREHLEAVDQVRWIRDNRCPGGKNKLERLIRHQQVK